MITFSNIISIIKCNGIPLFGALIISVLTAIAYSGVPQHVFLNWDDYDYILKNSYVKSLSIENLSWMFTNYSMGNWHPLTWLSLALNYEIWGNNPLPFKITSIVIHILNSFLVYLLSCKILILVRDNFHKGDNNWLSPVSDRSLAAAGVFAAVLFGVHPLHVESVSWISERKDLLYSFFYMLSIYYYIRFRETNDNSKYIILSVLMFLFSLMSKPMAVTLPIVLLLLDAYPLKRVSWDKSPKEILLTLLSRKYSFLMLAFLASLIALLTQRSTIQGVDALDMGSRIINACMSIVLYIYHFFWPVNLSTFYSFHPMSTDPNLFSLLPVAVVLSVTIWFLYLAIRHHIFSPLVCWLYIFVTLLPIIGIIKVGAQASADRYTYLPLLSLYIATAALLAIIHHRIRFSKPLVALGVIVSCGIALAATALTHRQNEFWKDDESVWSRAIELSPGTAIVPYIYLGTIYLQQNKLQAAIDEINKAISIQPSNLMGLERLGKIYELMGKEKLAANTYREIIRTHPEHSLGYTRYGDLLYSKKQMSVAKQFYTKAFELDPLSPSTLQRSALIDYYDKNFDSAQKKLSYLLQLDPDDIGGLQLMAKVKISLGKTGKAKEIARKILTLRPEDQFSKDILNQPDNGG